MKKPFTGKYKEYIYDFTEPPANGFYNKYIEVQLENRNRIEKEKGFYLHMGNGDIDRDEFPIPKCLTDVIVRSVKTGYYRYSHPLGRPTTREIIADYENFIAKNKRYKKENVGVVVSATGGFSATLEILMQYNKFQGEALITQPSFPVYEALMWKRFKIKKVVGQEKNGFLPTPEEISSKINKNTKFVVLISPNFPFGKAYSKKDLEKIVDISNKTKTYIILDEIFYDLPFTEIANIGSVKKSQKYIIRIRGFSKDRSVPGFRIGYVVADSSFIHELNRYANHYYGLPPSLFEPFIEKDLIMRMLVKGKETVRFVDKHDLPSVARKKYDILGDSDKDLKEYKDNILKTLAAYKKNRDVIVKIFEKIPDTKIIIPDAGFNLGVKIQHKGKAFDFFKKLYFSTGVIIAPGESFDMPKSKGNWYRITFANNLEKMEIALQKIKKYLKSLN